MISSLFRSGISTTGFFCVLCFISFEELSQLVFSLPFGLWDDQYNKYGAGEGNSSKYEVARGRVDGFPEGWDHVGDGEGDQPVEGCTDGGSYPPSLWWHHLNVQHPWNGTESD